MPPGVPSCTKEPRISREQAWAWIGVALVHALTVWIVTRPVALAPQHHGSPLQVVFIEVPALSGPYPIPRAEPRAAQVRQPAPSRSPPPAISAPPSVSTPAEAPAPAGELKDDRWDPPKAPRTTDTDFTRDVTAAAFNPIATPQPGRFRMRRQLSPRDVIRGASQLLGFWPPGYTDDPCGGLDKAVEMLIAPRNEREQRVLEGVVLERAKYCR